MGAGNRAFLRDLHVVTGFWVSGLALVLLVTGLPWANVWGDAFRLVRTELRLVHGQQDWKTGTTAAHVEHDHDATIKMQATGVPLIGLADIVVKAKAEKLPHPVLVKPPAASEHLGALALMAWTVKSEAQNRPLNKVITFDAATGAEIARTGFADKHAIDRAVGYGIAWHEGQLFGWINQMIGLFTALALITLVVTGFLMWRRRRPIHILGAPPVAELPARIKGLTVIMLALATVLPLLAMSLAILWIFDRMILPRIPRLSVWLGLDHRAAERGLT